MVDRFRRLLGLALVACLALPAMAQEQHETDPEAMKTFERLVDSYRGRPALRVKAGITVEVSQGDVQSTGQEIQAELLMTKSGRGVFKLNGYTCYLGDGNITAVHESSDHSYYSDVDQGSVLYKLMSLFMDLPFPHMALAYGDSDMDFLCMEFHQKAPNSRPTGVRTVQEGDRETIELTMSSPDDKTIISIDSSTMLINSIDLDITGGFLVQPGATLSYHHDFEYEVLEAAPDDELMFKRTDRQRVDMIASLVDRPPMPVQPDVLDEPPAQRAPLVGQPAPECVLETLDGAVVDISDIDGQVVVLDFWATWCGPCVRALPELHKIADWVREEQKPVRIFTINVYEIPAGVENTPDARLAAARRFWNDHGFSLPVLMDYSDHVAADYAVGGIPTTVVIRSDGIVHHIHVGGQDYAETVRQAIDGAIKAVEHDGD